MGSLSTELIKNVEQENEFIDSLLNDIDALEMMLEGSLFETGVRKIGAEQELFIIDKYFRPAPVVMKLLQKLDDDHFVTEFSKFNIEFNLDPINISPDCLSRLEGGLNYYIAKLRDAAAGMDFDVAMVGILPTIRSSDLNIGNLTPLPRYHALHNILTELKGGATEYYIKGRDEMLFKLNSSTFDFCNTAFQVHYQVDPENFAKLYNYSNLLAAPVLAAATNSPLLFGKRLWHETRIELAEQAIDTRLKSFTLRDEPSRIGFERMWVKDSILEIFRDDISRYRTILGSKNAESSIDILRSGRIPKLDSLTTFNGTVYKWNRACYGINKGIPHLRIENRILPSGPTVVDEVANAAFWIGLMNNMPPEYENIPAKLDIDEARVNFQRAAQNGLDARFKWIDNKSYSAGSLILDHLIPVSEEGLKKASVSSADIKKYLGIIRDRVSSGITGSQWLLNSFEKLKETTDMDEVLVTLTGSMVEKQKKGKPVHTWKLASKRDIKYSVKNYLYVDQIMDTELFTVKEYDLIRLADCIMCWNNVQYIPVEDADGMLTGLITKDLIEQAKKNNTQMKYVSDIMIKEPVCADKDMLLTEVLGLIKKHDAVPVTVEKKVIGIVTKCSLIKILTEPMTWIENK